MGDELRIQDNAAGRRYEAYLDDRLVAVSTYEPRDGHLVFIHTEVHPDVEGKGVGSRLAAGALADVRQRGLKVLADCPFIAAYLRRHREEYADLLAPRSPTAE